MGLVNLRHVSFLNSLRVKSIIFFLLALFSHVALAQNSVLNTGTWYKLGVTADGIYKIDQAFLQKAGISVKEIDPRHISIYGNGGGMLPQSNAAPRLHGLQENAIFVQGEGDGKFDAQDYLLFYGQSPNLLQLDAEGHGAFSKKPVF